MALSNSKLLVTQNGSSVTGVIFIFLVLLLNNVKSGSSLSFNITNFYIQNVVTIGVLDDASVSGGALQLTKKNILGSPLQHSVGRAGVFGLVPFYNKSQGIVANFTTEFSFVVNPKGANPHGDGMTFFLVSEEFEFPDPDNSGGGFLGLFNATTAFDPSQTPILAVEFDSFTNEWDPNPIYNSPHIGIDVHSIESVATVPWRSDLQQEGEIAKARISYEAATKELSVFVTYPNSHVNGDVTLKHAIDLTTVLSERVAIGFSAASGDLVETHDILSWSFDSSII